MADRRSVRRRSSGRPGGCHGRSSLATARRLRGVRRSVRSLSPLYSPSSTAIDLGTTTSAVYGDGSGWKGRVFSDLVSLNGPAATVRTALAAVDTEHGFFTPAACNFTSTPNASQGIFGLGG